MFCKTTLALPRAIVYQSQCSHFSGNIQELSDNPFGLSSFSLRKHLCHADRPGIPAPILTTFLCTPAAARARTAHGASQFASGMPLSGLSIIVMTVLYTSHEIKVSYSAPVPVEIPRFTCANQAFLPPSPFTLNFTGADCGFLPPCLNPRVQIRPFCPCRPSLILSRTTARARSAQGASQFVAGYAAVRRAASPDSI